MARLAVAVPPSSGSTGCGEHMALECARLAAERFVGEPGAGVDSVLDMRRHQFRAVREQGVAGGEVVR